MVDLEQYTKKLTAYHLIILVGIIAALWYMGVIQAFFGAMVVANVQEETSLCKISGEVWNNDIVPPRCMCPTGQIYEFKTDAWTCVPQATVQPTAVTSATAPVVEKESPFTANKILIGVVIILASIVVAMMFKKKK